MLHTCLPNRPTAFPTVMMTTMQGDVIDGTGAVSVLYLATVRGEEAMCRLLMEKGATWDKHPPVRGVGGRCGGDKHPTVRS